MHDPEFDVSLPKKPQPLPLPAMTMARPTRPDLDHALILLWPIPRLPQATFAEAFRQGLVEGLTVDKAHHLASIVNPHWRLRHALWLMGVNLRAGYPLEAALAKTGVRVRSGLLVALRTGDEHNCLAEALSAFSGRIGGFTADRYHRAIGRGREAIAFAAALAGLIRDDRLTVTKVRAAGRIATGGTGKFAGIIDQVASRMEDGESLADALLRFRAHFDLLYQGLIEACNSRQQLQGCLERLGKGQL